jgi:hypothetical protein
MKAFLLCPQNGIDMCKTRKGFELFEDGLLCPPYESDLKQDENNGYIYEDIFENVNGHIIASFEIERIVPLGAIRFKGKECLTYRNFMDPDARYEGNGICSLKGETNDELPDSYDLGNKLGMDTKMVMKFINRGVRNFGTIDRCFYAVVTKSVEILPSPILPIMISGKPMKGQCSVFKANADWSQGNGKPPLWSKNEKSPCFP